jgi:hypothetical protein
VKQLRLALLVTKARLRELVVRSTTALETASKTISKAVSKTAVD